MQLSFYTYSLQFKHPFNLSGSSRTYTPAVFVKLMQGNVTGYGEATLPPYLPETQKSVIDFISSIKINDLQSKDDFENAIKLIQSPEGNFFAKAALDIALHDVWAKLSGITVKELINAKGHKKPLCTFTLGMDSPEKIKDKLKEAKDFNILKVKLGGANDKAIITTIRNETDKPLCVDANQGWKNKEDALAMINWLAMQHVLFVEQPMTKQNWDDMVWLKEKSPLPLIADESFQTIADLETCAHCFDGINIKLMKCGGISQAKRILQSAKNYKLKILIGCMSESSCGVAAAASLQEHADWVDLDGPLLISNDPFEGVNYIKGYIESSNPNGLGINNRSGIIL